MALIRVRVTVKVTVTAKVNVKVQVKVDVTVRVSVRLFRVTIRLVATAAITVMHVDGTGVRVKVTAGNMIIVGAVCHREG